MGVAWRQKLMCLDSSLRKQSSWFWSLRIHTETDIIKTRTVWVYPCRIQDLTQEQEACSVDLR